MSPIGPPVPADEALLSGRTCSVLPKLIVQRAICEAPWRAASVTLATSFPE